MIESIRHDVLFAIRSVAAARLVSVVAILSLAVGIAANTTVFSLVEAVEFPDLIYPESSRIVFLESRNSVRSLTGMLVSVPDAMDLAASTRTLETLGLSGQQSSILRAGNVVRRVSGRRVTPEFFDVMRVAPIAGRVVRSGDGPGAIVLSEALWRSQFGADAAIVGSAIRLDGGTVTVIGVMPTAFDPDADFWTPLTPGAERARGDRQFDVFARLAPGASIAEATSELQAISARLASAYPASNKDWTIYPTSLARLHGRDARQSFLLLQAAVGLLLLIGCANIANILLARGVARRVEMAVRIALGASRARLIRGVLTEAVLLSLVGGALGTLLSIWGIRLAGTMGGVPDAIAPRLNLVVLGFSIALSLLTGLLCGALPAVRTSALAPEPALRAAGRGTDAGASGRLGAVLVVGQVAGALMLATCASLLLRSVANRHDVPLGFNPHSAVRAQLALPPDRYAEPGRVALTVGAVLEDLARSPELVAAGATTWALPTGAGGQRQLTLPGERNAALNPQVRRGIAAVTPQYFDALSIALRAGRGFTPADRAGSAPVAIVNEELAQRLWPNRSPVGQAVRLGAADESAPVVTVVGIVASVRRSPMHGAPVATVYLPFAQYPNQTMTLVARFRGNAEAATHALTSAVTAADPALLLEDVRTMDDEVAQFMAPLRLVTSLFSGFAALGLLLAAVGVFATMSYAVAQRRREMALRSALGADRLAIFQLVFGRALRMAAGGVLLGAVLTVWASRALDAYLFGVTATNPRTYAEAAICLLLVAAAACYRPARDAAASDPMMLLR